MLAKLQWVWFFSRVSHMMARSYSLITSRQKAHYGWNAIGPVRLAWLQLCVVFQSHGGSLKGSNTNDLQTPQILFFLAAAFMNTQKTSLFPDVKGFGDYKHRFLSITLLKEMLHPKSITQMEASETSLDLCNCAEAELSCHNMKVADSIPAFFFSLLPQSTDTR